MLTLDNVPLDDAAGRFYVLASSRVRNPPAVIVSDLVVPGQHGVIRVSNRPYGPGSVVLTMRVRGGSYAALMANYATLTAEVASSPDSRTLLDTEIAQSAEVDYVSISELEHNINRRMATCTVTFSIPRSFWRDTTDSTADLGTTAGTKTGQPFAVSPAPIADPVFVAVGLGNGATTDFKVTDTVSKTYFRFVGAVPTGQSVRIEPDTASAWLVASGSPWSGGTDAQGMLEMGPGQFVLSPDLSFTITKTGTTNTQVRARRAYL